MEVAKRTLDISEELATVEARTDDIQARIDQKVEQALELEALAEDEDEDVTEEEADAEIARLDREVDNLEASLAASQGYRRVLSRAVEQWDGTEIVMKELTGQEARIVKAQAQDRADRLGLGREQANEIRDIEFLKTAIDATPAGAPEPAEVHGLPDLMFDWLLNRANALNSVGEFDMGNSSLRERMMDKRQSN